MVLIVGLGNPGIKYADTRHNVGFMAVDSILKKFGRVEESVWREDKRLGCEVARVDRKIQTTNNKFTKQISNSKSQTEGDNSILLIKPQTFMNASGVSVAKVLNFYKINPLGLYVIHDEIDLPLGKVKVVVNRGAAGHHGVESIIKEVGTTNFVRVRVGIGAGSFRDFGVFRALGRRVMATENFVLEPFHKNEGGKLNEAIKRTVEIMEVVLKEGVERAMGKYN